MKLACPWPLLAAALLAGPAAAQPDFVLSGVVEPQGDHVIALRDVDGDGDHDLLLVDDMGVRLRRLATDGRFADEGEDEEALPWPARDLGWDLADLDGDGRTELAVLSAGTLRSWTVSDTGFGEGVELLTDKAARLPRGVRRLRMARDVDEDGRLDVILPGVGQYRMHRRLDEGYAAPIRIDFESRHEVRVGDPDTLEGRFRQEVSIPRMRIRDFDGDGLNDLISQTDDAVAFHVADPEIPTEATWEIDIFSMREELDREIDWDNLLGFLQLVEWDSADVDGRGANDFVLQQGGVFRLWLDGTRTGISRPPDQLLKSSGNVVLFLVRDVLGDELPELQIVRAEEFSLARLLRLLFVAGALNFDIFTYANEGGRFSDKPARRTRIVFEIPSLIGLATEADGLEEEARAKALIPARRLSLDGDGVRDDVVDLVEGELHFFRDVVDVGAEKSLLEKLEGFELDDLLETFFRTELDQLDDGGKFTFDLGEELRDLELTPGNALREATTGRAPDLVIDSPVPGDASLLVIDADQDGRSDLIVTSETDDGTTLVGLLVAREADD